VLLVEDSGLDRLAFRRVMQAAGAEVEEALDAEQALELLREDPGRCQVMAVDHGLPGMNGLELCRLVLRWESPPPLVILTGQGNEGLAAQCLRAGVEDYLVKDTGQQYLELLPLVLPEVVRRHRDRREKEHYRRELESLNRRLEAEVARRTDELEAKSVSLAEANVALKVLLESRDRDRQEMQEAILSNLERLALPILDKLETAPTPEVRGALLDSLRQNLLGLTQDFAQRLTSARYGLTRRELEVAGYIRDGKTSQDIAELLGVSVNSVLFHRANVRRKLGLKGKSLRLAGFLRQME
jgi:DNA-binding NarL/FixJ family response regulator